MQEFFIGIRLPEKLEETCEAYRRAFKAPRTVAHITVIAPFSWERSANELHELLKEAVKPIAPFHIRGTGLGSFGTRVLFVKVTPSDELLGLHTALSTNLREAGVKVDRRPYHPHITLATRLSQGSLPAARRSWKGLLPPMPFHVRRSACLSSRLTAAGRNRRGSPSPPDRQRPVYSNFLIWYYFHKEKRGVSVRTAKKLTEKVTWVGKVDWELQTFHGDEFSTWRGSSYNSYLIRDEKTVLIDTVWLPYDREFVEHLRSEIDLHEIDYIIIQHAEIDHSGALLELMREIPGTPIYCTKNGEKIIRGHFHQDWNIVTVKTGDTLDIGGSQRSLWKLPCCTGRHDVHPHDRREHPLQQRRLRPALCHRSPFQRPC